MIPPNSMPHEQRRGFMLVISSPSGAGKSSICKGLLARETDLSLSISATTRPMRAGEREGEDYHFMNETKFRDLIEDGALLEHARVFGNFYGTPLAPVMKTLEAGSNVLFDIDWQGMRQIKDRHDHDTVTVYILPPDADTLYTRLAGRGRDPDDVIRSRMEKSADEVRQWRGYDYVIINDDLEQSIESVRKILAAERLRTHRSARLSDFADKLVHDLEIWQGHK